MPLHDYWWAFYLPALVFLALRVVLRVQRNRLRLALGLLLTLLTALPALHRVEPSRSDEEERRRHAGGAPDMGVALPESLLCTPQADMLPLDEQGRYRGISATQGQ